MSAPGHGIAPPHRGGSRRVILVPERAALGYPAGRPHWRGSGCRDRMHNPASQGGYGWETAGPGQNCDFGEVAAKPVTEAKGSTSTLEPASDACVRTQVTEGHPAQVLLDASHVPICLWQAAAARTTGMLIGAGPAASPGSHGQLPAQPSWSSSAMTDRGSS
jgi:hypothetical protein